MAASYELRTCYLPRAAQDEGSHNEEQTNAETAIGQNAG
jgi:hypothetical protein